MRLSSTFSAGEDLCGTPRTVKEGSLAAGRAWHQSQCPGRIFALHCLGGLVWGLEMLWSIRLGWEVFISAVAAAAVATEVWWELIPARLLVFLQGKYGDSSS